MKRAYFFKWILGHVGLAFGFRHHFGLVARVGRQRPIHSCTENEPTGFPFFLWFPVSAPLRALLRQHKKDPVYTATDATDTYRFFFVFLYLFPTPIAAGRRVGLLIVDVGGKKSSTPESMWNQFAREQQCVSR